MTANRRLTALAKGELAFGSVTAAYQAISGTCTGRGVIIVIANSLDAVTIISLDGGTTDFISLPAGQSLTLDLSSNDGEFSGTVMAKHTGAAPSAGLISCGIVRVL